MTLLWVSQDLRTFCCTLADNTRPLAWTGVKDSGRGVSLSSFVYDHVTQVRLTALYCIFLRSDRSHELLRRPTAQERAYQDPQINQVDLLRHYNEMYMKISCRDFMLLL